MSSPAIATPTPAAPPRKLVVALVGNPNTGKSTLFNALSGMRQRVGNYPGVTVEKKHGRFTHRELEIELIDLPGTYSLAARSPDEMVTVDVLLGQQPGEARPDVVLSIVDATNLDRNLYLTTQLLDLGVPVIIALNMVDLAERQGRKVDAARLEQQLGISVIPIQAHRKVGLDKLKDALSEAASHAPQAAAAFPAEFERAVSALERCMAVSANGDVRGQVPSFLARRLLLDIGGYTEARLTRNASPELRQAIDAARQMLANAGCPVPAVEARTRYAWIRQRTAGCVERLPVPGTSWTDRLDRVLTHRVAGLTVFLALMLLVFVTLFWLAEYPMNGIEWALGALADLVKDVLPAGPLRSLLTDGVIAGVGGVLVFLPQILILFGVIAVLEDCGYMARAAFLMDKVMARCGLSGKSFIPLLSSFACAIPGVMAARVIEDRRDRLVTILVAPLMSCSARLPVYVLLTGAFIPTDTVLGNGLPGLTLFAMYMMGLIVAPLVAWTLKSTLLRGATPPFVMELPAYKVPTLGHVLYRMYDRAKAFVRRAGTLILASMIVVWALLYFPCWDAQGNLYEERIASLDNPDAAAELEGEWKRQSVLGRVGHWIEPAVEPLGWDWRIGMAALASFPAREVVVGTLGIIYDVGADAEEEPLREKLADARWEHGPKAGQPVFTVPVALSLMVFFALCCQCASTLAVIRRETNSWLWPLFTFVYMTVLAYVAALLTYQAGILL
jgi:ferrous iron transport protein B